ASACRQLLAADFGGNPAVRSNARRQRCARTRRQPPVASLANAPDSGGDWPTLFPFLSGARAMMARRGRESMSRLSLAETCGRGAVPLAKRLDVAGVAPLALVMLVLWPGTQGRAR